MFYHQKVLIDRYPNTIIHVRELVCATATVKYLSHGYLEQMHRTRARYSPPDLQASSRSLSGTRSQT